MLTAKIKLNGRAKSFINDNAYVNDYYGHPFLDLKIQDKLMLYFNTSYVSFKKNDDGYALTVDNKNSSISKENGKMLIRACNIHFNKDITEVKCGSEKIYNNFLSFIKKNFGEDNFFTLVNDFSTYMRKMN